MTAKMTPDQIYIRDLRRLVNRVDRISPPYLRHIEGPGYVMLDTTVVMRRRAQRRRRIENFFLDFAGVIAGASVGLSVGAIVALYLVNP
jgi:hypothetical protein